MMLDKTHGSLKPNKQDNDSGDTPVGRRQTLNNEEQALGIEEQATEWFTRLLSDAPTEHDIANHKAWLNANLMHQKAYREIESLWALVGKFSDRPEVRDARKSVKQLPPQAVTDLQRFRDTASQSSVHQSSKQNSSERKKLRSAWRPFALAASLVLAVLGSTFSLEGVDIQSVWDGDLFRMAYESKVHQTNIGEQQTLSLSDGSVLVLDTQTRVKVDFSPQSRRIKLLQGQAHFDVAHDKVRPFVVEAGNGTITALGTAFVVRKGKKDVQVTLLEGKVAVAQETSSEPTTREHLGEPLEHSGNHSSGANSGDETNSRADDNSQVVHSLVSSSRSGTVTMEAGQQLSYSTIGISDTAEFNADQVTAWQQGRLIFEDDSLAEVIEDLNRYSKTKILLGDESLTAIRVTGVFKSGDNQKAARALKAYFSMRVQTDRNGNLVLLPRRESKNRG